MNLKLAEPEQLTLAYHRDLKTAFPPSELKPLKNITAMWQEDRYLPWLLLDGEDIIGEAFLWLGHPGWALLDYLCVTEDRRNSGAGALMLSELRGMGLETLIESEAPLHAPDPSEAERRLRFYARCGCRTAGYDTCIFGVHYKTLYLSPGPLEDGKLMEEHQFIYQSAFPEAKYNQYVYIPWDPNREPAPPAPWNED